MNVDSKRHAILAVVVGLTLALPSCDPMAGKARQPDLVHRATESRVVMHVTWHTRAELDALRPGKAGTTRRELIDGEWHAYIDAVEPTDFNDFDHTETLGHECWHGFGAKHKVSAAQPLHEGMGNG